MHRLHPNDADGSTSDRASDYDWERFGRHRLRVTAGTLLDHPVTSEGWVATELVDQRQPSGWARLAWRPAPTRGWLLPSDLALGDIVEFGHGQTQWWGILDSYEPGGWLTVQGPYASPMEASREAERLLAAERYLPPIEADSHRQRHQPCTRRRRQQRRYP